MDSSGHTHSLRSPRPSCGQESIIREKRMKESSAAMLFLDRQSQRIKKNGPGILLRYFLCCGPPESASRLIKISWRSHTQKMKGVYAQIIGPSKFLFLLYLFINVGPIICRRLRLSHHFFGTRRTRHWMIAAWERSGGRFTPIGCSHLLWTHTLKEKGRKND